MKQSEKLDLILRHIYNFRFDKKFHAVPNVCKAIGVPVEVPVETNMLAKRLKDNGYVRTVEYGDRIDIKITSEGIDYCEHDSYSFKGHSIVTNNYNITGSPNANIITDSNGVNIKADKEDI